MSLFYAVKRQGLALLPACALLCFPASVAPAAEYISDRDGNWGDTNTWFPEEGDETYPQAGDEAYANHNIVVESAHQCGILHTGDGNTLSINPAQSLTIHNGGTWGAGTIQGPGVFNMANGTFVFDADAGPRYLVNGNVINAGLLQHTTAGDLYFNAGSLSNRLGAVYDLQGDLTISNTSGGAAYFRNEGTFVKSGGAGTATVGNVRFEVVNGTVEVQSGTLVMSGAEAACLNPTFNVHPGATYEIVRDVRAYFNGSLQGPGAGTVLMSTGVFVTCSDSTNTYLYFTNGGFRWQGGIIRPYNGKLCVNRGRIFLQGSSFKTLDSGTMQNEDYMSQTGSGPFRVDWTFTNAPGGIYDLQADGLAVTGASHFYNSGLLQKSAGAGESLFSGLFFHNMGGTIQVQTGSLVFAGTDGSSWNGSLEAAAGTSIELVRGFRNAYNGSFEGGGAGAVGLFTTGSTLICCTDSQNAYFNITNGGFRWQAGEINAYNGRYFVNQGLLIITGDAPKRLVTNLRNEGVIRCYGPGAFTNVGSLHIPAGGRFEILSEGTNMAGGGSVSSSGTIVKAAGSYPSVWNVNVTLGAGGEIAVSNGMLNLLRGITAYGGTIRLAGGQLTLGAGSSLWGGTLKGNGLVSNTTLSVRFGGRVEPGLSAGSLRLTSNITFMADGILGIDVGGLNQGAEYDLLEIDYLATLGGTVQVSLVNGFIPTTNDVFEIMRFKSRSGTFAAVTPSVWGLTHTATNVTIKLLSALTGDSDGDGLTDDWEYLYFGDPTNALPYDDPDGDTFFNIEEEITHTIPTNGQSYLRMLTPPQAMTGGTNWLVRWASDTGVTYRLFRATDIVSSNWTQVLTATGAVSSSTATDSTGTAATPRFYRVDVPWPTPP